METKTTKIELEGVITNISCVIEKLPGFNTTKWFINDTRVGQPKAKEVAQELLAAGGVVL